MKVFWNVSLFATFCLLMCSQAWAQNACSNMANKQRNNTKSNHVFGKDFFGQSIQADHACLEGNTFSTFSFWSQGNSPTKFTLNIYEGEIDPSRPLPAPRYTQPNIQNKPTNRGGKIKVDLDARYGDLSAVQGTYYTFLITMASSGGGNLIAHSSPNVAAIAGKAYLKNAAYANTDLIFEVAAKGSDIEIVDANYGAGRKQLITHAKAHMVNQIRSVANNGGISFEVLNSFLLRNQYDDPARGQEKTLTVTYKKGGREYTKSVIEKNTFTF